MKYVRHLGEVTHEISGHLVLIVDYTQQERSLIINNVAERMSIP